MSPSEDPARSAWQAMRTLVLDQNDRRGEVSARLEMSFIRIKALGKLDRGPMTMRELAGLLAVDAPYTTIVVDDLESRGLAERRQDPDDRRRKIVAITAEGRRIARRARRLLDEPPEAFAALSPEDLAHLDRIMHTLVAPEPQADPASRTRSTGS
jgi:DNA-binding MarR family transcriptional regulator